MKQLTQLLTVGLIKLYQSLYWFKHQILVSVFGYMSDCKHTPSCSEYALEQVKERGTIWGLWRACIRLLSCW